MPIYLHAVLRIEFVHLRWGTIALPKQHTGANCEWWRPFRDFHGATQCLHGREVWSSNPNRRLSNHHSSNCRSVNRIVKVISFVNDTRTQALDVFLFTFVFLVSWSRVGLARISSRSRTSFCNRFNVTCTSGATVDKSAKLSELSSFNNHR